MSSLVNDVRQAARVLLKHPGYLATALLTLVLGIGFSTATFSVVHGVLLRPLPYHDPERLLVLRERRLPVFPEFSVAPGHYLTWRDNARVFDGIAAWGTQLQNVATSSGEPERIRVDRVTANLFPLLGATPVAGRTFTEADDESGAPRVVLLSHGAWQRKFGGGDVTGQTIRIGGEPTTIVGVMPSWLAFPSAETEMWVPMAMTTAERHGYGNHYLGAIARMRPGVTTDRARSDLALVAQQLEQSMPDSSNIGWEVLVVPLHEYTVRNVRLALLVLFGAVSMVLLIACVNVANLLLARGISRQKELAIRAAIGATRGRLVRQLLVEQVALASVSGAGGLLVAAWLLRALFSLLPDALPRQADIHIDAQVLAFALLLAAGTPLVFGLLPAVQASRPDLRDLLARGGRQGGGVPARRIRRVLVTSEIALAMVLLVAAGLLMRSFDKLSEVSPGFSPERTVVATVNLPAAQYPVGPAREQFFGQLVSRSAALPGVIGAALAQSVPMGIDNVTWFEIEGSPLKDGSRPSANFYAVSPEYFAAMRIPLLRGRSFTDRDRRGSTRVVIINQLVAERHFGTLDPIGRRIRIGQGDDTWREVVGVAGDVKQYGLADRTSAQVYEPYLQHPYFASFYVVIRTADRDPAAVIPEVRSIIRSMDADLPLGRVRRLDDVVSGSIRPQRFSTVLILLFGGVALLLAAIGIYGIMSHTVGMRTYEFAIRVAHGAGRRDILQRVLGGALSMAAIGVAIGGVVAWLLRQSVEKLLFGVTPDDRLTYAAVALVLTTVALIASAVPAFRATRVDPMVALRGE